LVWLYKKAVLQNLEFIADSEASKKISDKKAYQLTLLKITTQENCVVLTNHFYQSLIKKRIVMLNKNQSNKRNYWKYAVVLPLLGAFVFFFQVEVVAQEKTTPKQENETKQSSVDLASSKIEKDLSALSKGKEIYINGEKSSENELTILNPNDIEKTVKITEKEIYINGAKSNKTEMDKLNPDEIATINVIKNNDKQEIRIITKKHAKMANDNDIYINDKKVSQNELDVLDQETIETMDVNKDRKTIRIVTKKGAYNIQDKNAPVPPTPPTPPVIKIKAPTPPAIPKAPKAPKGDPIHGDKKAWKEFEKQMDEFDAKMKKLEPQMEAFDKQMAEFGKQMEPFNKEMEAFEEKMKVFEKQMEEYQSNLNAKKGK
jgi:hypothetical protein